MKAFIVAGEASGDLYAGQIVEQLKALDPSIEIRGWGGDCMTAAGATVTQHYRDLAYMGFWEVLKNIRTIHKNLNRCWEEISAFEPDLFLGVDFPGFNLRMARRAKASGITVHHYISPSIWAWRKGRLTSMRRDIDRMHVILPFEAGLYEQAGIDVRFVGHPLLDVVSNTEDEGRRDWALRHNLNPDRPILALLPGSRTQELRHMLPVLCAAGRAIDHSIQPVIAGAPGQPKSAYASAEFPVVFGATQHLLRHAQCAWVTSGTATLESALFKTPQIIVYKTSKMTYMIAKMVAKVPYIGLPNILANQQVVPELIQSECTAANLLQHTSLLLGEGRERNAQLAAYEAIHQQLGTTGAAKRVAQSILSK